MKRNPWPCAIIAYFLLFVTGIIAWVSFAMRHDEQLVRPDYYEHEIKYQAQIDRMTRAASLGGRVKIESQSDNRTLLIALPATDATRVKGRIHLYRPSNAKLDQEIALALNERGSQTVNLSKLQSGLWKVALSWTAEDREYYSEKNLILP